MARKRSKSEPHRFLVEPPKPPGWTSEHTYRIEMEKVGVEPAPEDDIYKADYANWLRGQQVIY